MLRSHLCDYSDVYIVLKGIITVSATDGANDIRDKKNIPLPFKNNAPLFLAFQK